MDTATLHAANGCILLQFSARPRAAARSALKAAGWRWDDYCGGWYATDSPAARRVAAQFAAPAPTPAPVAATPVPPPPRRVDRPARPVAPPMDDAAQAAAERADTAAQFREKADVLAERAAHICRPMTQNFTPKRNREYLSRCHDGRNLDRAAQLLRALADLHAADRVPPALRHLRPTSWKAAAELVEIGRDPNCGYYECRSADDFRRTDPVARLAQSLISGPTPEEKRRAQVEQLESALRRDPSADGFFPTPKPVAARLVERLDLRPGCRVLEPSAGIGTLCEAVAAACPTARIVTVERLFSCRDILDLKGWSPAGHDFLDWNDSPGHDGPGFDFVVMNPPFEHLADCDHVRHAFELLRPGGRLVSIMSPAWQYRDTKKAVEFRDWVAETGARVAELPPGWCDGPEAFRPTKVAALILTVDKSD